MRSQVGLRKHHYKQSYWRWWNFSRAISNPKRWCCDSAAHSMPANLENTAVATGWKRSVFIPIPKKINAKECSNFCTIALVLLASKVMLKILQARLQQYVNWECPDVQAGFRKGRWVRNEIANIRWIIEKAREFQKTSTSASLIMLKALCGSQQTVGNSERAGNTRAPDLLPEKPACRSKRNS